MNRRLTLSFILLFYLWNCYAQKDDSNTKAYVLPEILKTIQGEKVNTQGEWEKNRRAEIIRMFENNVYGQMPKDYNRITSTITREVSDAMGGRALLREVTLTVWKANEKVEIYVTLFTPLSKKRSSVFLLLNHREKSNTDPTRNIKSEFMPAEMVIENGYAIAAFQTSDVAPDDENTYQNGVLKLYPEQLTADNGMKAIGSWAWAASRVLDYFETNEDIDSKRVNLVGHSRGGKAALWAGAQDRRFAMVISNCSGNTGAALARRNVGESVKAINTRFPHWFADSYKKFNDNVDALPVDQHMLIALIAPRPLYTSSATEDLWADPIGSYISISNAQKVYALYGKKSRLTAEPPAPDSPIINSILGYHIRTGSHDLTAYDWSNFIKFADFHYDVE